jgi:C6 transcription factor Pro1
MNLLVASTVVETLPPLLSAGSQQSSRGTVSASSPESTFGIRDQGNVARMIDSSTYTADLSAVNLNVGAFIWFDTMSCASLRTTPTKRNHRHLIEDHNIQLDQIMGCENWVMMLIMEISTMDEWKRNLEKVGRLSTMDLVKRATQIEELVRKGMEESARAEEAVKIHTGYSDRRGSESTLKRSGIVTNIFANCAITYLHVVVSGALPELPEIKESVMNTIRALKLMPDPSEIESLVWPFCITSCLALEGQRNFFEDLISASKINESSCGNLWKAFMVVRECWKMRDRHPGNFDWTAAMDSLGYRILLV